MQRKGTTYAGQYQAQFEKLLATVKAEATELAVKFGFQRGPLLRQRDWWEANEKDFEQFYLLEVDLDEDRPEVIRIACLSSLEMVLEPETGRDDGSAEDWMESPERTHGGPAASCPENGRATVSGDDGSVDEDAGGARAHR